MESFRHFHLKCRRLVCTNFCDEQTGQKQYVSLTRARHSYYLCLVDKGKHNYYIRLTDKGET